MSSWFNPSSISAYTLARTSQINGLFTAVQVAFDKLPDPDLIQQNRIGYVVDTGPANALAVTMPITLASYAAGICLRVKILNSNTGAATINVDGLGAVAIKRADGSSLLGAELLAGSVVDLTYDGTVFRLPPVIVALTAGDIATITAGLAANYEPKITAGSAGQYWRYDKTWATLDKTAVGLANVDNVADANKPISTAQQNALNLKLDISVGAATYFPLAGGTISGNAAVTGTLGVTGTFSAVNNATVGGTLGVTGTLTANGLVAAGSMTIGGAAAATQAFVAAAILAALPAGVITIWSGSSGAIPAGWLLCDGTNGTPNLRDKFVVGAGSTYAVGATGGSANATLVSHSHTITITDPGHTHTANVTDPGHTHNLPGSTSSGGTIQTQLGVNSTAQNGVSDANTTGVTVANVSNTTGITAGSNTQGSSATNANLPPYYALCYIMKA